MYLRTGPPNGCFTERFYEIGRSSRMYGSAVQINFPAEINAGSDYPARPPQVKFLNKINLPGVDAKG